MYLGLTQIVSAQRKRAFLESWRLRVLPQILSQSQTRKREREMELRGRQLVSASAQSSQRNLPFLASYEGAQSAKSLPVHVSLPRLLSISVRSEGVATPTMIHFGLGAHNLLQMPARSSAPCTAPRSTRATRHRSSSLPLPLLHRRHARADDGRQEGRAHDDQARRHRHGQQQELDLTSKEQVKWLFCTITCSSAA